MSIKVLAEQYNQFQHDFGQGASQEEDSQYEGVIDKLFSPKFKKIANGSELAGERAHLLPQLKGVKDFAGAWSIQSLDIIPSSDNTKCTIRYFLKSEKAGQFEVIAILSALQGQIDRIDEIYYQQAS